MIISLIQNHNNEYGLQVKLQYNSGETCEVSQRDYGNWKEYWDGAKSKIGFGLGNFGEKSFGWSGFGFENADYGEGFGIACYQALDGLGFGYGNFGIAAKDISWDFGKTSDMGIPEGTYSFKIAYKDVAGNISYGSCFTRFVCKTPQAVSNLTITDITGQTITLSWS